ncbi:MAG: hypothetical protein HKN25_03465 [Pyrinomonadaceae bacterium]|nr:hypothetical protein [Pyrinomonadaceae bacterium]
MKHIALLASVLLLGLSGVYAQKGIDKQTDKVKDNSNVTRVGNDVRRSWSFGKGKTKIRKLLPNPYELNSRKDQLIETIVRVLKNNKMIVDESASRFQDGMIITQPFIFVKGSILTKNELNRYAVISDADTVWTRGRYSLTIDVESLDGIRNNVAVNAKVEGRSENGIFSEWSTLESTGIAEDEFLAQLVNDLTGGLPDEERKP